MGKYIYRESETSLVVTSYVSDVPTVEDCLANTRAGRAMQTDNIPMVLIY